MSAVLDAQKSKNVATGKFLSQIAKSLGEEANKKTSRSKITIISKYIDELTTKEKMREALEKQSDIIELQESAYGETSALRLRR